MIQLTRSAFPFAALSEPGLVREKNEDRYSITSLETLKHPREKSLLAVLCDGVGGEQAGEVAAEMAVNLVTDRIIHSTAEDPVLILQTAIQQASAAIRLEAQNNDSRRGMASTIACVWIIGQRLYTATVGDSRIYLVRNKQILQLSTDHTWLQEAFEMGLVQQEEKENHPNAHVIRRFLGSETPPEVDFRIRMAQDVYAGQGMELQPGDILFLCSDGCSDLVVPDEILARLQNLPFNTALNAIKTLAYERGGKDNITMIAVQVPEKLAAAARMRRITRVVLFALAVLLAAIMGLYLGWKSEQERIQQPVSVFTPQQFSGTLASPIPTKDFTPQSTGTIYPLTTPTMTGYKPGG